MDIAFLRVSKWSSKYFPEKVDYWVHFELRCNTLICNITSKMSLVKSIFHKIKLILGPVL